MVISPSRKGGKYGHGAVSPDDDEAGTAQCGMGRKERMIPEYVCLDSYFVLGSTRCGGFPVRHDPGDAYPYCTNAPNIASPLIQHMCSRETT